MAKTVTLKKAGTYTYKVTGKTADTIYEFASDDIVLGSQIKLQLTGNPPIFARQGNDLVIAVQSFAWPNIDTSFVTIKNYYEYMGLGVEYHDIVKYVVDDDPETSAYAEADATLVPYIEGGYYEDTNLDDEVLGGKQNNYYEFKNGTSSDNDLVQDAGGNDIYYLHTPNPGDKTMIYDFAGNDIYKAKNTTISVGDYKGNDVYKVNNGSTAEIMEFMGNDEYELTYSHVNVSDNYGHDKYSGWHLLADSSFLDYEGNEKYTISDSTIDHIEDYAGNDTYTLTSTTLTNSYGIQEYAGNDKYTLTNVSGVIGDAAGNDVYNVVGGGVGGIFVIQDGGFSYKSGNDKYTVSSSNNVQLIDYDGNETYDVSYTFNAFVRDVSGNDTYNLNYVAIDDDDFCIEDYAGNDKYTLNYVSGAATDTNRFDISDSLGNDTYTVKDSEFVDITDIEGNDKYALTSFTHDVFIGDDAGNDTYTLDNVHSIGIEDYGTGNDTYTLTTVDNSEDSLNWTFYDEAGNEKYTIKNSTGLTINDGDGKDAYTISDSSWITITDNDYGSANLSDTYTVTNTRAIDIYDEGYSNDTYTITGVNNVDRLGGGITDEGGKNKYTLKDTKNFVVSSGVGDDTYTFTSGNYNTIQEAGGADVYNIKDEKNLTVNDALGNDTYNLTNVNNFEDMNTYKFNDDKGNDKYTLKNTNSVKINDNDNTANSVDVYNISDSLYTYVDDKGGKNTFNIKNVKGAAGDLATFKALGETTYNLSNSSYVELNGRNTLTTSNKYVVSNSKNVKIQTGYGSTTNDTYSLTNVENADMTNYLVYDNSGNDNYTVKGSSGLYFRDDNGDDTYTVDNLKNAIKICDENGDDTATITGLNTRNVVIMADFNSQNNGKVNSGNLYVLDRTQKGGYMIIDSYLDKNGSGYLTGAVGTGYIEKLYAGKTEMSAEIMDVINTVNLDVIGQQVASWLNSSAGHNAYANVDAVFNSGNAADIASFITTATNIYDNYVMN